MAELLASWTLEDCLKKIDCSEELKHEINIFINNNHERCTGSRMSISNLYYRNNLQYILENITKIDLLTELQNFNKINN